MRKHFGRFLLFALLFVTGCSDSPQSVFRSALNGKNEVIDSLMKVCDEGSAVVFHEKIVKDYMTHLKSCKDKLDKWAFNRDWVWATLDPKNPNSRDEILKKVKKDSRPEIGTALDATEQYLAQEEKNLSRVRHEIKRLQKTLAMLQETKPGDYSALAMLTQEYYYTRMLVDQPGGGGGGGGGAGAGASKGGGPGGPGGGRGGKK